MKQKTAILFLILSISCSKVPTTTNKADLICNEPENNGNSIAGKNPRGKVSSCKSTVHQPIMKAGKISYEADLKRNAVHETCLFDSVGNIQEVIGNYLYEGDMASKDGLFKTKYKFNSDEKEIEEATYEVKNETLSFIRKDVNVYDTTGNLIEVIHYDKNEITGKTVRKFDDATGTVIEYYCRPDGSVTPEIISLKYDSQGNELERINSNTQTKKVKSEEFKTYDSNNNRIKYRYEGPIGKFQCVFKYDDKNNVIDKTCLSSSGPHHTRYEYVYDRHCNWTKKTEIVDNIPYSVTIRVFEYR
jgi:hypothetical protein